MALLCLYEYPEKIILKYTEQNGMYHNLVSKKYDKVI